MASTIRHVLMLILSVAAASPSYADELDDLPELACALASTPLERQHIGCPSVPTVEALRWTVEAVQLKRPRDARIASSSIVRWIAYAGTVFGALVLAKGVATAAGRAGPQSRERSVLRGRKLA